MILLAAAVPVLFLTGTLRTDLSLILLLFCLVYKSLIYALVVSVQSRWQLQPEAALRILGRLIEPLGRIADWFVRGCYAWQLALGAVGRAGFLFLGRWTGPLIGLRVGRYTGPPQGAGPAPSRISRRFRTAGGRWSATDRFVCRRCCCWQC